MTEFCEVKQRKKKRKERNKINKNKINLKDITVPRIHLTGTKNEECLKKVVSGD